MKLSHKEALSLQAAMVKAKHAWESLYNICPAGGFTEYVDESKECKHCGAPTSKSAELAATDSRQLKAEICSCTPGISFKHGFNYTNNGMVFCPYCGRKLSAV